MALYVGDGAAVKQIGALYTGKNGAAAGVGALYTAVNGAAREIFAPGRLLYDYEVGEIVEISENGVPARYIVCERGYLGHGNMLLVRERALPAMAFRTDGAVLYENSLIDRFLTGEFTERLDASVRGALQEVALPIHFGADNLQAKTILRSVFLLSLTEVGGYDPEDQFSPASGDGTALSWFIRQAAQHGKLSALRCQNEQGQSCDWWLRTPLVGGGTYADFIRCILDSGTVVGRHPDAVQAVRPALVLRGSGTI